MKTRSALKKLLTVFLALPICGILALADDAPTFSDPDVNAFVKAWAQQVGDTAAVYRHIKTGALSSAIQELQVLQSKTQELNTQAVTVVHKLKPDEKATFLRYISDCDAKETALDEEIKQYLKGGY